ncbi:MAG: entericidin A/B family lipoprotein [Porphyrobacter sp.]|nr:entericidin A/B family lipoprotein [Porphyrobacter sp.]
MIRKTILVLATGAAVLLTTACNTVEGAGEDLESASNTVEKEL